MTPTEPIRIEIANQGRYGNAWGNSVSHAMMLMRFMELVEPKAIPPKPKTERITEDKPTIPLKQRRKMLARKKRR